MTDLVRLYQYKGLLSARRPLSADDLMAKLEISRATLKRDLAKLRDQLRVPVVFDRDRGGYVLKSGHELAELPGLWFAPEELLALATMQQMLAQLAPGLLSDKLEPIRARLQDLIRHQGLDPDAVAARVRLTHSAGKRRLDPAVFQAVAAATTGGKRLRVTHYNRQTGEKAEREVSPQRLVAYHDNWYLDAWCHLRGALRSFAVDALSDVTVLSDPVWIVDAADLDRTFATSYGIFAGTPTGTAVLRFTAARARWVRRETWHPQQSIRELDGGEIELSVPYSDERELAAEILRYSPDVEVMSPVRLQRCVRRLALQAARRQWSRRPSITAARADIVPTKGG